MARKKKQTRRAIRTEYIKGSPYDRIKNFYLGKIGEDQLHKKDKELKWRYENVWALYQHHMKSNVAIKYHIASCQAKGIKMIERTAWRDFQKATKLWGKAGRVDKQAKLVLLDEMATETYFIAKDQGKLSQMNRAISNLIKVNEQTEDLLQDTREAHSYELHIHLPGEKKIMDLNKLPVADKDHQKVLQHVESSDMDDETFAQHLKDD